MSGRRVTVVLNSLVAEGTPVLALELCRVWQQEGIEPSLVTLSDQRGDLLAEFEALRLRPHTLRLGTGPRRYVRMASGMAEFCKRVRANAVLSFPLGWHAFFALGAKWAGVDRIVAHVGNYPPHWTGRAFDKFRFQVQLGRPVTAALACCSEYVREGVIQHFGVPSDEAVTVYNGVRTQELARRAEAARSRRRRGPLRVGMVARLEVHKDQPTLIRATAALRKAGRPIHCILIGDGSRRAEYELLAKAEGVEDVVHFLGSRRDVPEQLGELDVFVFAAKPDEGFGIALVEAMAAGVPIVATDVGACREVLNDGEAGLLVPPGNPLRLAEAISEVVTDVAATKARVKRAKTRATGFSMERMADAYANLLGLGGPPSSSVR